MPSSDDTIIVSSGPISAMLKWNWNYRLMLGKWNFRAIYFWLALIVIAGMGWLR